MTEHLGQLMMIGLGGSTLNSTEKQFLKKVQPSGVIYFRRNVESPGQLKSLSKMIYDSAETNRPLIAIDQEGGRVARLSEPFTEFPGNDALGHYYEETGKVDLIRNQATAMARELKAIGVNYNFTPIADIDSNPKNPIIGGLGRSFGKDPRVVAHLVMETIKAYNRERVVSCAKHFPGHGDTFSDSHKVLPTVKASKATLFKRELVPFLASVRANVPTMMTAHVMYPALDPTKPATLSPYILNDILRKKLQFKGVLVSDDLEMKAIAAHGLIREAAVEAIVAGVDLLLVCKSLERAREAYQDLLKEYLRSSAFRARANEAVARVVKMKKKYLANLRWPALPGSGWAKHRQLSKTIHEFA